MIINNKNILVRNIKERTIKDGKCDCRKFDEKKSKEADNIKKITIQSLMADVNVSVSNSSNIEAHFYGRAKVDGDIKFNVEVIESELKITLDFEGSVWSGKVNLDIKVPRQMFKKISVKSASADVILCTGVFVEDLKISTKSGDILTNAKFTTALLETMSGYIDIDIEANKDIKIEATTMSGDIEVNLDEIGYINLSAKSMSGDVKNRHKEKNGYKAKIDVSTMSGDINIR